MGVAVPAALGEGDGFEGGGQGFERAGDPRGWWPTPGGGEGLGSAWVGAALLEAVGRVIPGRQGCRELLEVKPGGERLCFSVQQHSTDTFLMCRQGGIQIAPF